MFAICKVWWIHRFFTLIYLKFTGMFWELVFVVSIRQKWINANSEQVAQLKIIVNALPKLCFHVDTISDIPQKFVRMSNDENVSR